ncbi:hypothetical protein EX895_005369 [Sporisorium graminicola]|uniref:HMG box domain-containing protein n=1 Tax=Sporisorium graminicola TaxID=280036 RepID=A0A4U7KRI9_9BASI|nr:hypothetical protein EX895_005369 [Sporisorium graminicola]TKY85828.1 hypothetical protein EX895_005369 [Sporisorium graminicola]
MTTRSTQRGHVAVDLFHGWSTDVEPGSSSSGSSSASTLHNDADLIQDQHDSPRSITDTALRFQTILFPKRDHSFAVSLYTGCKDEEELEKQEVERFKRLPPSKRPGVSHAKKTPPDHIKRPRNAYIIFRSHTVSQKLIPKEVENDHRNISRIIAHMWKSLKPEDRAHYEQIAKEEKERHKQLFPNYRYQPITRRAEVNKRNVKKLENGDEECQEIADIILKAQGKEGVVVRSEPSKQVKRVREATHPAFARDKSAPRRKRAKVAESKKSELVSFGTAEQALETVFLHTSPCNSTTSAFGSDAGNESAPVPSPEPFRLASRTSSVDLGQAAASPDTNPATSELSGRRASSAPILRPGTPPSFFEPVVLVNEQIPSSTDSLSVEGNELRSETAFAQIDGSQCATMPAPSWKSRKPLPPPIPNTWQLCSYDDQSLPSPRTIDSFAWGNKATATRPRTAWPSTPSSGTFRDFFHPWAFEHANGSMLVSPMTATFQDLRRRSSLVRSGLLAARRPGSFGVDAEGTENYAHSLLPTSGLRIADAQLLDEEAQAAGERLGSEAGAVEMANFAFDPALEGEGYEPAVADSTTTPALRGEHAVQHACALPRSKPDSPRPSFSGSTLAAAARDWASMKRRRSRMAQSTVARALSESMATSSGFSATCDGSDDPVQREADKSGRSKISLEESLERAVMLALGRDQGHAYDRGEQSSKIVQQILISLSAELGFPSQQQSASA